MPPKRNIETLNALSLPDFRTRFWSDKDLPCPFKKYVPQNGPNYLLLLESAASMKPHVLEDCYQLVNKTSSAHYAASSRGWHPAKKREEMRLLDLKYVLPRRTAAMGRDGEGDVGGFLSFMLTYEDGVEVIYCYEIHIEELHRGNGLGRDLMGQMEEVGREAGVRKAMLTVFKGNGEARRFYGGLGYEVDEFSPRPKKLRGGRDREVDYIILSKSLVRGPEELMAENAELKNELFAVKKEMVTLKEERSKLKKSLYQRKRRAG